MDVELTRIVTLNRTVSRFKYRDNTWYLWGKADLTDIVQRVLKTTNSDMDNDVERNMVIGLALREYLNKAGVGDEHNVALYKLRMMDNPKTSFSFVIQFLNHVLSIEQDMAERIAQEINDNGHADIGPYSFEIIETTRAFMRQISTDDDQKELALELQIISSEEDVVKHAFELVQTLIKQHYPNDL